MSSTFFPKGPKIGYANNSPDSGVVGVWCLACGVVCVVRPFPGGRHSHAARRLGRNRGASGAGDAVNGKENRDCRRARIDHTFRLGTVEISDSVMRLMCQKLDN